MLIEQLTAEIQNLKDIEAIKKLKYQYCLYCDQGYQPALIVPQFCEDGIWDGGPLGKAQGKQALTEFFSYAGKILNFAAHFVTNPIIDVDGDKAMGKWLLLEPIILKESQQSHWLVAGYEDTYKRVNGQWKFDHIVLNVKILAPTDQNFGKEPIVDITS